MIDFNRDLAALAAKKKGRCVFVHISAVERSRLLGLSQGDRVIVDVVEGRKGLEAARVRLV